MRTYPVVRFVVAGQAPADAPAGRPWTLVYDGNCRVCNRLASALRAWDARGELEVIPSQTTGLRARYPWIPASAYAQAVQLVHNEDGRTWQGAAAIEQLLDVLPKGCIFGWVFHIPLVRPLADRFYRWFARNRYRLGCGEHCTVRPLDLDFHDGGAGSR